MQQGISRRSLLLAGLGSTILGACASAPTESVLAGFIKPDPASYPWTRGEVDALPYAQLCARYGKEPAVALVLGEISGGTQHWHAGADTMIAIQGARVVETRGLKRDLVKSLPEGTDPLASYTPQNGGLGGTVRVARRVDIRTPKLVHRNAEVIASLSVEGEETIDILERRYKTLRVREDFRSDDLQWQASNTYWLSQYSPMAWKSIQHLAPGAPPLTLEVLKKAV